MSHANEGTRLRILPVQHPARIARPDSTKGDWIITSPPIERIQVRRHWNKDRKCTEPCTCEPACHSMREDYFTAALQHLPGASQGESVWEPVVLHLTEATVRGIYTYIRTRGDDGDLKGLRVTLSKTGADHSRTRVWMVTRGTVGEGRPLFDVGQVLIRRLGLTVDFFGHKFDDDGKVNDDQVVAPARSRLDKPHVPLGKK